MVLAYLMIYQRFTLADAVRHVSQYRRIAPNRGFLQQLQHLEMELHYSFWRCYMFWWHKKAYQLEELVHDPKRILPRLMLQKKKIYLKMPVV